MWIESQQLTACNKRRMFVLGPHRRMVGEIFTPKELKPFLSLSNAAFGP
jgi:hypothetical protein